ncbi:uncharacterized protein MKK02DRAFT_43069 [Dioszegia hungarica]|uniref:Uncharacterized protein n=1 Tax=Dioszegia hungarica TaxID=4972 RepID=A0AA38LXJ3_9TREE|nr:uncharacterized protein MKK02DRAFT_43069 [Dioszegia hungarica]KAI9638668.1 hypothetical protein MKK02DRAFT_43069 [Dioszegia hungarica]
MPRLHTLNIHGGDNRDFHTDFDDFPEDNFFCDATTCPLIANLRPSRLVLYSSAGCSGGLFWSSPMHPFPPPWIRELTVHFRVHPVVHTLRPPFYESLRSVPRGIERLRLVLEVEERDWAEHPYVSGNTEMFWDRLAGNAQRVEYIGAENIQARGTNTPSTTKITPEDIAQEIREAVTKQLRQKGWTEAKAEARAEEIIFTTKEEYEKRQRQ